jgi:hypothetical protein
MKGKSREGQFFEEQRAWEHLPNAATCLFESGHLIVFRIELTLTHVPNRANHAPNRAIFKPNEAILPSK